MKVLVLGATSAIAQETVKLLATEGGQFFLVGRNRERLEAVAQDLLARYEVQVDWAQADLNDFERHAALLERALRFLGRLDVVLVAHGTLGNQKACEKDFNAARLEIETNFLSAVSLLTIVANDLEARRGGCIAVISSVAGDRGRQSNYIYGAAKGGLNVFLQGLRNRLHPAGVSVITMKPGFVDTPMTDGFKKGLLFVKPETVAPGIVRAIKQRRDVVYLPFFWRYILLVIRAIPESIFKRLRL